MHNQKKVSAVILMAGIGSRLSSEKPKQFHRVHGKHLYLYTVHTFESIEEIDEILLVCHPDWIHLVKKECPNHRVIEGGSTRQESSFRALLALKTDIVLFHDAVRPKVSKEIIKKNIHLVEKKRAINTCIEPADTLAIKDSNTTIESIPLREKFFIGQTPQTFLYPLIYQAHVEAKKRSEKTRTDDCSLVLALGHPVHVVEGHTQNFKVTTQSDLEQMRYLLSKKKRSPKPKNSLEKNTYILIGSTGGIGKEIHKLLEKEGAKVIPISRNSKKYPIHLENPSSIKEALEAIYQEEGEVDGLINTAGYLRVNSLKTLSFQDIHQQINVNLTGVIYACKEARIRKGGHIINFASSSFAKGRGGYGIYSACKAAIVNFTEALAEEEPNFCINTLVPPRCSTPMRFKNFPNEDLSTLLSPSKVAESTISLLKDPFVTGSIIELDPMPSK